MVNPMQVFDQYGSPAALQQATQRGQQRGALSTPATGMGQALDEVLKKYETNRAAAQQHQRNVDLANVNNTASMERTQYAGQNALDVAGVNNNASMTRAEYSAQNARDLSKQQAEQAETLAAFKHRMENPMLYVKEPTFKTSPLSGFSPAPTAPGALPSQSSFDVLNPNVDIGQRSPSSYSSSGSDPSLVTVWDPNTHKYYYITKKKDIKTGETSYGSFSPASPMSPTDTMMNKALGLNQGPSAADGRATGGKTKNPAAPEIDDTVSGQAGAGLSKKDQELLRLVVEATRAAKEQGY